MVMRIPVGKFPHYYAIVDDEDYEYLSQFSWHAKAVPNTVYAQATVRGIDGKRHTILMHRLVMDAAKGTDVDHANRIGLDNRRENLRFASKSQNAQNARKLSGGTSPYKGVRWQPPNPDTRNWAGRWRAHAYLNGKQFNLGSFADEQEAARAYDQFARDTFGEFARLNFPEEGAI